MVKKLYIVCAAISMLISSQSYANNESGPSLPVSEYSEDGLISSSDCCPKKECKPRCDKECAPSRCVPECRPCKPKCKPKCEPVKPKCEPCQPKPACKPACKPKCAPAPATQPYNTPKSNSAK